FEKNTCVGFIKPYTSSIAFFVTSQVFPDFFTWPFSIYFLSFPLVQDALTVPGCKPHFSSASLEVNTSVSGTSRSGSNRYCSSISPGSNRSPAFKRQFG